MVSRPDPPPAISGPVKRLVFLRSLGRGSIASLQCRVGTTGREWEAREVGRHTAANYISKVIISEAHFLFLGLQAKDHLPLTNPIFSRDLSFVGDGKEM